MRDPELIHGERSVLQEEYCRAIHRAAQHCIVGACLYLALSEAKRLDPGRPDAETPGRSVRRTAGIPRFRRAIRIACGPSRRYSLGQIEGTPGAVQPRMCELFRVSVRGPGWGDGIEPLVLKELQRLERSAGRLVACHVTLDRTVEGPVARDFDVLIELVLASREGAVHQESIFARGADAMPALQIAFARAQQRLVPRRPSTPPTLVPVPTATL